VTIDPFLYVALGLGLGAGRLTSWRSAWIGRATQATIVFLVFVLGIGLGSIPGASALLAIPTALGFAAGVLGLTLAVFIFLPKPVLSSDSVPTPARARSSMGPIFLIVLVAGYAFGLFMRLPTGTLLTGALYVLLALVGFDLKLTRKGLPSVWIPLTSAAAGAVAGALIIGFLTPLEIRAALATSLAFGWYSLAGPLVAARLGASLGLLAFLVNFFRENLTMIFAPYLGSRIKGEGIAAMGGATAMDTTLYFVVRYGGSDSGSLALASGLFLTIAASVILPLVLALPGA
jgi:uncharacterized membrane protein YbjE (DUF340 family)